MDCAGKPTFGLRFGKGQCMTVRSCLITLWVTVWLIAGICPVLSAQEKVSDRDAKFDRLSPTSSKIEQLRNTLEQLKKEIRDKRKRSRLALIQVMDERLLLLREELRWVNRLLSDKDSELQEIVTHLDKLRSQPEDQVLAEGFVADLEHLEKLKQLQEESREELLAYRRTIQVFLARLLEQNESYEQAAAELVRSTERVDALLKKLEQRRKALRRTKAVEGSDDVRAIEPTGSPPVLDKN